MKLPRTEIKRARIEIIPMIDAIFFLLVFFMMASLQMVHLTTQKVKLPESSAARDHFNEDAKVVVSINKGGDLFVDSDKVVLGQLTAKVEQKIARAPEQITVIINCDREQHMDMFSRVFDLIKQANPAKVMLATSPRAPGVH